MRILYVEDNMANLYLVKRVARSGNHEVINYIEGEDALTNIERDCPDLILMDIQLAGQMSGLDVVRKLREKGHTMPIVAVTAYAMVGDRERCVEAGCDDYIAKPLPIPQLIEIFERYQKPEAPLAAECVESAKRIEKNAGASMAEKQPEPQTVNEAINSPPNTNRAADNSPVQ